MVSVMVTLSEWLFRSVLAKSVLTLSRDYFHLRKPLERRVYELARKHCGRQPAWRISVATLHHKAGSAAPLRVFRAAVRRMIVANHLPDYTLVEEPGDIIAFARRDKGTNVSPSSGLVLDPHGVTHAPVLRLATLTTARTAAPGVDIYALEAEWRDIWTRTGRTRLRDPDAAFLGWVKKRLAL